MKELKMPSLSPTMERGKIVKWIKREGEEIRRGDVIAEIETDKAAMEYESEDEGRLGKIIRGEGEEVAVGETIGVLLGAGEELGEIKVSRTETVAQEQQPSTEVRAEVTPPTTTPPATAQPTSAPSKLNQGGRVFISPLARVIAQQNNIDYTKLVGTGPNNRIVKADVLAYMSSGNSALASQQSSSNIAQASSSSNTEAYTDIPNSSMRKTIAKRLLESKTTIPHYYLNVSCVVDDLIKARTSINLRGKDKYKISINDFIIKAVGLAMKEVPAANSYWQGETSRQFAQQDVAVAVAIPNGLITPIIRDVCSKGLVEISNEMKSLAKRAKEGNLKPHEYQGGGFSISNLGMYGIDSFAAIINPPQSGILAVGALQQKPIVVNGNIVVGNVIDLVLSADHRVLDGAVAAVFVTKVREYLENPTCMLL